MTITLRPASVHDVPDLVGVSRLAFTEAFGHLYDPADLQLFLDENRSAERIAAAIAHPDQRLTLAVREGEILGYCLLHLAQGFAERPEPRPARPALLSQLYCRRHATGLGLGAMLMADALEAARARGCDAVQLSVYCDNTGAQRFYERLGFRKVADIDFWVGNHRDDEFLLEKPLP